MNFFSLKNLGFNKKKIFFSFVLISLLALLPFTYARAGTGAAVILWALVWFIFPFVGISLIFSFLTQYLMDWVLNWNLTYTNPSAPDAAAQVLKTGLDITFPLANIIILLAFLVIALATILRIETYGMKKILPTLIIIGLLINFAPTILGVIMDGANLLMKFFLNPLGDAWGTFSTNLSNLWGPLATSFGMIFTAALVQDATGGLGPIGSIVGTGVSTALTYFSFRPLFLAIIISIFSLISGMTFLCFAFLFIIRYFKIWIAVILSPVYIALYILPGTRKYFQQWWNDFIKWALIGIVGAFYLYIGAQIYSLSTSLFSPPDLSGVNNIIEVALNLDILRNIIVFLMPIIFLALAFLTTFQTAEAVYKAIESGVKTMIDFAKKTAFPKALRAEWIPRVEKARGLRRREEKEGLPEVAARVSTGLRHVPFFRHMKAAEELEKYGLEWENKISTAKGKYQHLASSDIADKVAKGDIPIGADAAAAIHTIVMRGDSQDIFNAFKKKYHAKSDEELLENKEFKQKMEVILRDLYKGGMANDVVRRDPRLAAVLAGKKGIGFDYTKNLKGEAITETQPEEAIRRAVQEMRDSHLSAVEADVFKNEIVVSEFAKNKNADTYRTAIRTVKNFAEVFNDTFEKIRKI